ncbi:MAG: aldolase [Rhodospirillaceae bacterium]|nr:MAG: aldolase [Rhodospirillaceae bacterium]
MSDSFHDREQSFEAKNKLDEELKFKAEARRNKLVGLWAAEKMGIEGADADAYAKAVVISDLEEPGIEDVIRKVMGDFKERKTNVSEDDLRAEMDRQMGVATEQVKADFDPLGKDHA